MPLYHRHRARAALGMEGRPSHWQPPRRRHVCGGVRRMGAVRSTAPWKARRRRRRWLGLALALVVVVEEEVEGLTNRQARLPQPARV